MDDYFMARCADFSPYMQIASLNEPISTEENNADGMNIELIDTIIDPRVDIELEAIQNQLTDKVRAFVLSLSPYLRCVALRHFWDDQSQVKIAQELGVTRSAISHAIKRIVKLGSNGLLDS